jgi:hypothetical protein
VELIARKAFSLPVHFASGNLFFSFFLSVSFTQRYGSGHAVAQVAIRCVCVAETRVQSSVTPSEINVARSSTAAVPSQSCSGSPANHPAIAPYRLSPPHEVCDSPDQAAHCHTLFP